MPVAIIMFAAAYFSHTTLIVVGVFMAVLKLVALAQRSKLTFNYDKTNEMYRKFVDSTQISNLVYEPFILSPTPILQGIIYLVCEVFYENIMPTKFERELIKLSDGGTIGLDWDGRIPDPEQAPT